MSNSISVGGLGSDAISLEAAAYRFENIDKTHDNTITLKESGLTEEEFATLDKDNSGSITMKDYMDYLAQMINSPEGEMAGQDNTTTGGIQNNTSFV